MLGGDGAGGAGGNRTPTGNRRRALSGERTPPGYRRVLPANYFQPVDSTARYDHLVAQIQRQQQGNQTPVVRAQPQPTSNQTPPGPFLTPYTDQSSDNTYTTGSSVTPPTPPQRTVFYQKTVSKST